MFKTISFLAVFIFILCGSAMAVFGVYIDKEEAFLAGILSIILGFMGLLITALAFNL